MTTFHVVGIFLIYRSQESRGKSQDVKCLLSIIFQIIMSDIQTRCI